MDAKQSTQADQECQECSEGKQATHECVECALALCELCQKSHSQTSDDSESHTLRPLTSAAWSELTSTDSTCPKHKTQPQLMYCCDCETTICMLCKLTAHADHSTEDLLDTGREARVELTQELQSLGRREQVLQALLKKSQDFEDDVQQERQGLEQKMQERAQELRQMVERAQGEALKSVAETAENTLMELQKITGSLKERHAVIKARVKNVSQLIQDGDDRQAVALLAQIQEDKRRPDHVLMERGMLKYEFRTQAVKYVNVLAFIGAAVDGPVMEATLSGASPNNLEVSVHPRSQPSSEVQLFFRRQRISQAGRSAPVEIHYSKNPNSTLAAMHLMSTDDDFWLSFNPGGNVTLFALFDDDGNMKEVHSENIPSTAVLVTCDGNTVLSMNNGRWVRPGEKEGGITSFTNWGGESVSKSSTPYLLKQTSIYRQLSDALPPKIDAKPSYTFGVTVITRFDVSEDGRFVAITKDQTVKVYDKVKESTRLRSYADYVEKNKSAPSDVCFCRMDGREVLLAAYVARNTVHVLDHKDGCYFIHTLETEQHPLQAPCRLATNHHGRVWVGCNAGKVVIFDV